VRRGGRGRFGGVSEDVLVCNFPPEREEWRKFVLSCSP